LASDLTLQKKKFKNGEFKEFKKDINYLLLLIIEHIPTQCIKSFWISWYLPHYTSSYTLKKKNNSLFNLIDTAISFGLIFLVSNVST